MYGNQSTAYYDIFVVIGGQRQRLTADTGSHLIVVNSN